MSESALTLAATDFELFGVPQRFTQDRTTLDLRWKQLQREAHPDRFVAQSAASQRLAMQWSVRINEAYQRLKDPLKRAAYLCELAGAPINAHDNTAMPADFLMQQMAWREALDEAPDAQQAEQLHAQVLRERDSLLAHCAELLDCGQDAREAVEPVRSLMFIERFCADIEARIDALQPHGAAPANGPVAVHGA